MTAVARALGLNRQYLYEILPRYCTDDPDIPDAVGPKDTVASVGHVGPTDTVGSKSGAGTVGSTRSVPLTYGALGRTFRRMSTAVIAAPQPAEDVTRIAIDMPRRCLDWLEREALR